MCPSPSRSKKGFHRMIINITRYITIYKYAISYHQCNTTITACVGGTYGSDCNETCGNCKNQADCYFTTGHCNDGCDPGYEGDLCIQGI